MTRVLEREAARRLARLRSDLACSLLPHELLTPLTAVMGLASLLHDKRAIDAGQVKEVAEGILQGARELEVTITKFLLYAEIQTAQQGASMEPARAAEVLAEAARGRAGRAGREADVEIDLESFRSPMSSDHLEAMVRELVENALEFSKPGSAVKIRGRRDGVAAYLLSVTDQGRGLTSAELARIERAPFLRRNREHPGLGLGLTIVRKLAEMYGGRVSFETVVGEGTSVHIRFTTPRSEVAEGPLLRNLWLDAADVITAVDEAWLGFARDNEAPELTRRSVLGRPLGTFVGGPDVVELTGLLTAAARQRTTAIAMPFRCDSPEERRFMTMTLQAEPGGAVHIEYRLDRSEPRAAVSLLDRHAPRSQELVYVCSWCRRVRVGDDWRDAERAIADGELFGPGERMPMVSHGICVDCRSVVKASMRREALSPGPASGHRFVAIQRARSS